jgi:CRISPR-associated endonuclease/helicase Cas3
MKSYSTFFKELLKEDGIGFSPYPFQINCFEKIVTGHSILLQAPTGSGKTWSALIPFIFSWSEWKNGNQHVSDYPRKAIYSLPLRTLANSLYEEVKSKIEQNMPQLNLKVTMQTGENPVDPFFEGDIIFTTIDQTLSNILTIPLSLPTKLANINAAAVLSSYLIFDEFHLLDPHRSLNTTISILKLIGEICPFCLMTATLSDQFLNNISELLNASIIRIKDEEYKQFSFVKKKAERSVFIFNEAMDIDNIINQHRQKSIVICNTVDSCVGTYKALQHVTKQRAMDVELICIHSRFFQTDRKEKEKQIKKKFSKDRKSNVILVSTQIVEVGLDISCDVMHTELCPINSVLQRIGRCARWGGPGRIFIYDVPDQNYRPYDDEMCRSTMEKLTQVENQNIDFYSGKKLINDVLAIKENEIFREIKNNDSWSEIKDCWQRNDKGKARELIRNINSISVVLLPEYFETNSLYKYDSLSINPYSLKYRIENLIDEVEGEIPFYTFALEANNFFDDEDDCGEIKRLQPVDYKDIPSKDILVLNSNIVGYSKDYGLDFYDHFGYQSKENKKQEKILYSYRKDTYEEHIKWMIEIYEEKIKYGFLFPIKRIQARKYDMLDFNELIKYMIVMHDYGKLSNDWQRVMNAYQNAKEEGRNRESEFLAHSDSDQTNEQDNNLMKEICYKLGLRKPSHSGAGAFISYCVLPHVLHLEKNTESNQILKIILTAILRHHGAATTTMSRYEVADEAITLINNILVKEIAAKFYVNDTEKFPFKKYREKNFATSHVIQFNNPIEAFTYFILVRILRLCDQKSFEKNPLYMEHSK